MISVIIPTFNKSSRLNLCLHCLSQQSSNVDFEVIIINDGSTDDTTQVLDVYSCLFRNHIRVINTSNIGRAAARNLGVQQSLYDLLLFLDDDLIVNKETIKEHIKAHCESDSNIVHGRIMHIPYMKAFENPCVTPKHNNDYLMNLYKKLTIDIKLESQNIYNILSSHSKASSFEKLMQKAVEHNNYYQWLCFVGANTSIKKNLFYKAGGFDNNFQRTWGCEDIELGYRIYQISDSNFIYHNFYSIYHLDHFRKKYMDEHKINMSYFLSKYDDKKLESLSLYFNGSINEDELLAIGKISY